jgi:hypothetical protein
MMARKHTSIYYRTYDTTRYSPFVSHLKFEDPCPCFSSDKDTREQIVETAIQEDKFFDICRPYPHSHRIYCTKLGMDKLERMR